MHTFTNDYSEGAAPEILEAIVNTNMIQEPGYGEGDCFTARARDLILQACELDAKEADVEFCVGGTSANVVGVVGLLRDWEGVICTPDAHINVHETGAVQACGRTILPTSDTDGFLSVSAAQRVWDVQTSTGRHMTIPGAVYITNATEFGGVWTKSAFDEICDWADEHNLPVYADGARIASALTSPECHGLTLAHIAHRASAFTLGGTKNGMLLGEAMVMRNARLREAFPYIIKQRGGLLAKSRLMGIQFCAAFEDGLYWRLAEHANECAFALRDGLCDLGFTPFSQSASNQQFFICSPDVAHAFCTTFGTEVFLTLPDGRPVIRFVTSWATEQEHVQEVLEFARRYAK